MYFVFLPFRGGILAEDFECPSGFEAHDLLGTFYVSCWPCNIHIQICCKWDSETHTLIYYVIDNYMDDPDQFACLFLDFYSQQYSEWLDDFVLENIENVCFGDYPPCDHPTLNHFDVERRKAMCYFYKLQYTPPLPGEDPIWKLSWKSCGFDSYCKTTWRICYDYSYNPKRFRKTLVGSEVIGTVYCDDDPPTVPPPGKTMYESWETNCARVYCTED